MTLSHLIFVMLLVKGVEASLYWKRHTRLLLCIGVSAEKSA